MIVAPTSPIDNAIDRLPADTMAGSSIGSRTFHNTRAGDAPKDAATWANASSVRCKAAATVP